MTEIQEIMLSMCFGGMCGIIIAECIFIIVSFIGWVRDKVRKHKEAKKSRDTATKVE